MPGAHKRRQDAHRLKRSATKIATNLVGGNYQTLIQNLQSMFGNRQGARQLISGFSKMGGLALPGVPIKQGANVSCHTVYGQVKHAQPWAVNFDGECANQRLRDDGVYVFDVYGDGNNCIGAYIDGDFIYIEMHPKVDILASMLITKGCDKGKFIPTFGEHYPDFIERAKEFKANKPQKNRSHRNHRNHRSHRSHRSHRKQRVEAPDDEVEEKNAQENNDREAFIVLMTPVRKEIEMKRKEFEDRWWLNWYEEECRQAQKERDAQTKWNKDNPLLHQVILNKRKLQRQRHDVRMQEEAETRRRDYADWAKQNPKKHEARLQKEVDRCNREDMERRQREWDETPPYAELYEEM
jgi:hypothetical protein